MLRLAACWGALLVVAVAVGCDQAAPAVQRHATAATAPSSPPPPPPLTQASLPPRASLLEEPQPATSPEFAPIVGQDKLEPPAKPVAIAAHKGAVTHLEYWPNAEGFVSAGADGRLCIWKDSSDQPLQVVELPAGERLVSLAISIDSRQLLYTTGKQWMAIVDLETGQESRRIECPDEIHSVAWSSDSRLAASGHESAVRFWNLDDGSELIKSDLGGRTGKVHALAFSPDCRALVVANGDWTCPVVAVRPQAGVVGAVRTSRDSSRPGAGLISRITVSPSGRLVATTGGDGSVSVAHLPTHLTSGEPQSGPQIADQIVEFSPGPGLAAAFLPGEAYLFCVRGFNLAYRHLGAQQFAGRSPGSDTVSACSAISPNGKQMVAGLADGRIARIEMFPPLRCAEEIRVQNVRGVLQILNRENFDQLEEAAKNFRAGKGTAPWGDPLLQFYYDVLATPAAGEDGKRDFEARLAVLERWRTAKPDSATARIALAGMYIQYAWDARGSGFAYTVTDEGRRNFAGRIELAQQLLEEAIDLDPNDCAAYHQMITVGKALGWPEEKMQPLVDKSLAIDPNFFSTYRAMADYLRPQWQGEPGDIAKFAAKLAERLPEPQGDEAYGNVALVAANCEPLASMYAQGFSRKRLLAAARQFVAHYPDNAECMAFASRVASLAGDRKLAAQAFRYLQGATGESRVAWPDSHLLSAYERWAFEISSPPDTEPLPGQLRCIQAHIEPVRSLAFSPDGQTLATASGDPREQVKTWNVADGKLLRTFRHESPIAAVAFSASGKRLAAAGGAGAAPEVRAWSLASQKRPAKLTTQVLAALTTGFSHDDDWFATGGADGLVVLLQRSKKNKKQAINHEAIVQALAFAPKSNLLATGAADGEMRIFDLNTLSLKKTLPIGGAVNSVGFAGNSRYAVATADNQRLAVCDVEKGEARLHEAPQGDGSVPPQFRDQMRGHYGPLACSKDSTKFVLAHINHMRDRRNGAQAFVVELWDAVDGGRQLGSFHAGGQVTALALSPDGKTLATADAWSGRVRLWDLEQALAAISNPADAAASAP